MLILPAYIQAAMDRAQYEIIGDDGSVFATIPGFDGLWANAPTESEVNEKLATVLEGWLLLGIAHHHLLPVIDGIDLTVHKVT